MPLPEADRPRTTEQVLAGLSHRFEGRGEGALSSGERATLRRLDPLEPSRGVPVMVPLLLRAGLPAERLRTADHLRRWAAILQAMALLSGTAGLRPHAPRQERDAQGRKTRHDARDLGRALHRADFSEARLMRLTTAHGAGLFGLISRMARFLAGGTGPLDLAPVARLVLHDGRDAARADAARLDIARGYYGAEAEAGPDTQDAQETAET